MVKSKKTCTWWMFVPLTGIYITDKKHDLGHPIFGDATVISKDHLPEIVKELGLGESNLESMTYSFQTVTLSKNFESMVAVKRRGIPFNKSRSKKRKPGFEIPGFPEIRANEIGALVGLAILAESADWMTCGLVDHFQEKKKGVVVVSLDAKEAGYSMQGGSGTIIRAHNKMPRLSRTDLKKLLYSHPISHLTNILGSVKGPVGNSLQRTLSESSRKLFEGIHNANEATQLLSAVTAIEILLANSGDTFETVKRRITALVGKKTFDYYRGEEIFHERHLYIHRGKEPSHGFISLFSSGLALCSILRFAEAAPSFTSKVELINYLDFLHFGEKMSKHWSLSEKRRYQSLRKHSTQIHKFKFFKTYMSRFSKTIAKKKP